MIRNLIVKIYKLSRILVVPAWRWVLLQHRVAAGIEHTAVLRQLVAVQTVVDIGANRGQFALTARYCFPEARIVSFEPLPEPAAIYRAVFDKDVEVRLVEAAIGAQSGQATIHLSARDDSSSLLPITERQNTLFPGTAEAGKATIRVTRLEDELTAADLASPALLKLDVQGFEMEALHGCEPLLSEFDWIYCECSFVELYSGQKLASDVIEWLAAKGFHINGMYNTSYDREGKAIQADFLFSRIA